MREEGSLWSWALIKASIIQFPFVALNACWLHDEFLREFSIDFLASYGNLNNESQRMSAILRNCLTLFLFNNSAQFISINLIKTIPSPFLSHVLSTDYTLLYKLKCDVCCSGSASSLHIEYVGKIYDGVILTHSEHYKSVKMWFETMLWW